MTPLSPPAQSKPSTRQITAGAEAIAAAQFARCGFDVSVQSGADKPWYDLVATRAGLLLKVSVRGSDDGRWPLTQPFLKSAPDRKRMLANRRDAIDFWLGHHGSRTVCCLVQFLDVPIEKLPRIYLASPSEVAQKMREAAERLDDATLYESYEWMAEAERLPSFETLPASWGFSEERIEELLGRGHPVEQKTGLFSKAGANSGSWPSAADTRLPDARIKPVALGVIA